MTFWEEILNIVVIYSDTIPPLLLLTYIFISQKSTERGYILVYIVVQAILNTSATIIDQWYDSNNIFLYHINCLLSLFILIKYLESIIALKNIRSITIGVFIVFYLFYLITIVLDEGRITFNSKSFGLASFFIVVYCLLYYREQLKYPKTESISRSKDLWYVTGIFAYYGGTFSIVTSYRILTTRNINDAGFLWKIHNVVFLIMCIYIFIGIICKPLPKKYS